MVAITYKQVIILNNLANWVTVSHWISNIDRSKNIFRSGIISGNQPYVITYTHEKLNFNNFQIW